ncbi:MAG TPA: hypothetical protein VK771_04625, partial [Acidimicrobiia bacterium]|nr:hypothetical protein [Acidimicrobiia bacterium]
IFAFVTSDTVAVPDGAACVVETAVVGEAVAVGAAVVGGTAVVALDVDLLLLPQPASASVTKPAAASINVGRIGASPFEGLGRRWIRTRTSVRSI